LLPLLLAGLDYLVVQRLSTSTYVQEDMDESVYDAVAQHFRQSKLKFLVPAALLSIASALIFYSEHNVASTSICPATTYARTSLVSARLSAMPLDFCIVFSLSRILRTSSSPSGMYFGKSLLTAGCATLVSYQCSYAKPLLMFVADCSIGDICGRRVLL